MDSSLSTGSVSGDVLVFHSSQLKQTSASDDQLLKRESSFSTFRSVKMLVCTFNVDAAKPDALMSSAGSGDAVGIDNIGFLETLLASVDQPDILVFGFQEMIDLESKKMTASEFTVYSSRKYF